MTKLTPEKVVRRTACSVSAALDKMVTALPGDVAPQYAIEQVVKSLTISQPWFMRLIMEDRDIAEAYANAARSIETDAPATVIDFNVWKAERDGKADSDQAQP
jgi:hypothetical protein